MSRTYLDNAAATPCFPDAIEAFGNMALRHSANIESEHLAGQEARNELSALGTSALSLLGAPSGSRVSWFPSATDAIVSLATLPASRGGNAVSTRTEHPAVMEMMSTLAAHGTEVRFVPVLANGLADPDAFAKALDPKTKMVALTHVNSETGVMQDLCALGNLVRARAPNATLFVDTVQAAGRFAIPWSAGIDLAVIGGHKIGSPCGGMLVSCGRISEGVDRLFRKLRLEDHAIGRADLPAAAAFCAALRKSCGLMGGLDRIAGLDRRLRDGLVSLPAYGAKIKFTAERNVSPFIVSFRISGYQGATLARMLGEAGIMVSSGSACESAKKGPSRVLSAMGIPDADAYGALRVSFWYDSTESDVDAFLAALPRALESY